MVVGVTEGFTKKLQLVGVGYRSGQRECVNLFWVSHPVEHPLPRVSPQNVRLRLEIVLKGADKQVIGQGCSRSARLTVVLSLIKARGSLRRRSRAYQRG